MATNKRLIKSNDEGGGVAASFNTVTYTGNASTLPITGVGFEPDFVWIKQRSYADSHNLWDRVRGLNNYLITNVTSAALSKTNGVTSLDTDGFTLGNWDTANTSGQNYVAWCWKAGGAAVTNTDGTITSQVSANTEAGFSIVSYTGNGVGSSTIGHGLGNAPSIIIIKGRNRVADWNVFYNIGGNSNRLYLNQTSGDLDFAPMTSFSSSTINLPSFNSGGWNESTKTYISYCFAEVAGFSKFGSYTGNGLPLGPSIDLGFEPAFVMIKCSSLGNSSTHWVIKDNKRDTTNPNSANLYANLSNAEDNVATADVNFFGNGFQPAGIYDGTNKSGQTYIYMAFANQF